MSGVFGTTRRSRARSPVDDYAKRSLLTKVSKSELKLLRVAVRRGDIIGPGPQLPLERSIDDPLKICAYVHYRKDESKRLQPPIFKGKGIKVNQDFTENREVFTDEKHKSDKSSRKSRSRSKYRSRSSRNRTRSPSRSQRSRSREKRRRSVSLQKSRSRSGNNSKRRRSNSKRRRSNSRRRRSSDRPKYKDDLRHYSSQRSRYSRSLSRSISPYDLDPNCPVHGVKEQRKSLTPLRPGEYRPGHPDLAWRNKRYRLRSRSNEDRERSRKSRSRDDLPSTSKDRSSPGKHAGSLRNSGKYQSSSKMEYRSRSPIKGDRYRRRSRSPYNNSSPTKRPYRGGGKSGSSKGRSRSPQYGENVHEGYGYYEGWPPGPRLPAGRGGYPMQPFYAPAFHPRGMMPLIPPGHMIVPRMPMMPPFGPYGPRLPVYNSGAVRPRGSRPYVKSSTVTSDKDKEGDNSENSRVVISEVSDQDTEKNEGSGDAESRENAREGNGDQAAKGGEENNK